MDWKTLFLTHKGRISKREFWIGFLVLFVAGLVLGLIPFLGALISVALIYPWVCIYIKRLHDFDKPAILVLVPLGVTVVAFVLAMVMGMGAMMGTGMAGNSDMAAASAMAGFGGAAAVMGVAALLNLAFVLWVGLSNGTPGDNQFGPPPIPGEPGLPPPTAA